MKCMIRAFKWSKLKETKWRCFRSSSEAVNLNVMACFASPGTFIEHLKWDNKWNIPLELNINDYHLLVFGTMGNVDVFGPPNLNHTTTILICKEPLSDFESNKLGSVPLLYLTA